MQKGLSLLLLIVTLSLAAWAQEIQVSVNLPANGAVVPRQFTLTGTSTPSMIVEVSGSLQGSVYANRNGQWAVPLDASALPSGTVIYLDVQARDNAYNGSRVVQVKYAVQ